MFTERKYYFGHFRMRTVDHCDNGKVKVLMDATAT